MLQLGDSDHRTQIEAALKIVDDGISEFEKLVEMKTRAELLEGVGTLKQRELQTIVLACVLIEQQRRADRSRRFASPATS
jgi:hypothetical protein